MGEAQHHLCHRQVRHPTGCLRSTCDAKPHAPAPTFLSSSKVSDLGRSMGRPSARLQMPCGWQGECGASKWDVHQERAADRSGGQGRREQALLGCT